MNATSAGEFDVFLSYQRNAADIVRPIAEALLSRGVKVWFNEYEILIEGRQGFWEQVERGLNNSKKLIYFSDKRYVERTWCTRELDAFADGQRPVLEIVLEPNELWSNGGRADHGESRALSGNPQEAWPAVCAFLGIAETPSPWVASDAGEGGSVGPIEYKFHGITYEAPGWQRIREPCGDDEKDLTLGGHRLTGNDFDCRLLLEVADVASQGRLPFLTGINDDFLAFRETLEYAGQHRLIDGRPATCIGTHILMHSEFRHAAVTYRDDHNKGRIIRKYSVVLPSLYSTYVEFHVTWVFYGAISVFWRLAHRVDSIVRSIRWEANAAGRLSFSSDFMKDSGRVQRAVADYLGRLRRPGPMQTLAAGALVVLGAIASACGGKWFASRAYRRAWLLNPSSTTALFCLIGVLKHLGEYPRAVKVAVRHYIFHISRDNMVRVLGLLDEYAQTAPANDLTERVKYGLRKTDTLRLISPYSEVPYLGSAHLKALKGEPEALWLADIEKARTILRLRKFARKGVPQSETFIDEFLAPCLHACHAHRGRPHMNAGTGSDDGDADAPAEPEEQRSPHLSHPEHYREVSVRAPGEKRKLTLAEARVESHAVLLTYCWHATLSHEEADCLDSRVRAYVSCAIHDAAVAAGLSSISGPTHGRRPSWLLGRQGMRFALVNAGFDVPCKTCSAVVAPDLRTGGAVAEAGSLSERLAEGFRSRFAEIEV